MPSNHNTPQNIAKLLTEASPYIRRYQGKTIVIKYGGNAMLDKDLKQSFAQDLIAMKLLGINPVVVHGGGPQINEMLEKMGKESTFISGLRVTDSETMDVVERVLGGVVNKEIVDLINALDGCAVGLTGKDGNLIYARKLQVMNNDPALQQPEMIDYGHVGEVESVNPEILHLPETRASIPIIAPIGMGRDGQTYNINADQVAGKLAITLHAEKLMLVTNMPGVLDKNQQLVKVLKPHQIPDLIANKTIVDGMIPKVECALDAIQNGVNDALILDGRVEHALLLELFTDSGVGTQIL